MTYGLAIDETPQAALRRIGCAQIDRACKQLRSGATEEGVHEARKCFKRLRALLKLMRLALPKATYQRENTSIRDIAHLLSQTRDLDVMPRTLDHLATRQSPLPKAAVKSISTAIAGQRAAHTAQSGEGRDTTAEAVERLQAARKRLGTIKLERNDFAPIARAAARCLATLAEEFATARGSAEDEDWHDWRKIVQLHWRQSKLLAAFWPELLEARVEAARKLADALGLDHDISVLKAFVAGCDDQLMSKTASTAFEAACQGEQKRLRAFSEAYGLLLTATAADDYERQLRQVQEARLAIAALEDAAENPA